MFERYNDIKGFIVLPFSGNKYQINIKGIILDDNGNTVNSVLDSNSDLVVELEWLKGKCFYNLAYVIACAFKPMFAHLPMKYWSDLNVLFADNDRSNLHPSNLVWKYPVALGASENNGFAFIPMFSRYMINRAGSVFDRSNKRIVPHHYTNGYAILSLKPDVGTKSLVKRHRLVCFAFTDYTHNLDFLQVNHINGKPGDDRLENLEWCTGKENVQHAIDFGFAKPGKPVIVTDLISGKVTEFTSLTDVCKKLNLVKTKVCTHLCTKETPYIKGNISLVYKFLEHTFLGTANINPILVRDLRTKQISEYKSVAECAKFYNMTKGRVQSRVKTPTSRLQPDGLQFKKKSDNTPWYEPVNLEQELENTLWGTCVLIRNVVTNEVLEFETQRLATKYLMISESIMHVRLNTPDQQIYRNNVDGSYVQIKYKSDPSPWRTSINPEEEYLESLISKPVLVKNVRTNEVTEYKSAKACSDALGILTTTLNYRLKSRGQKLHSDGLQYKYKDDIIPFKIVDEDLISLIISAPDSSNTVQKTSLIAGNSLESE